MTDFDNLKLDIEKYVRSGMTEANRAQLMKKAADMGINAGQLVMLIKNAELELKFATGASNTDYPDSAGSGFMTAPGQEGSALASGFQTDGSSSGFVQDETPSADTPPPPSGQPSFSDIRILDVSGAMSDVYSAIHDGRRKVIIKRIKSKYRTNPSYVDLFCKEFESGYALDHPGIVRFYGRGEDSDGPFYYMEHVEGRTLADFIHREHNTDPELIRRILIQLLGALKYMHERQIFHRDLKPDNIMLTYKGNNVKIIDFGLAAADSLVDNLAKAGTPRYAAPELMTRASLVDQRSDIYSVGMMLIEIFAGVPNRHNLMDIPHELFRCMADKATMALPDHRYQTCDEMLALLEQKQSPLPAWLEAKIKEYAADGFISRNERLVLDREIERAGVDKLLAAAMINDEIEKAIRRREELCAANGNITAKGSAPGPSRKKGSHLMAWLTGIAVAVLIAWAVILLFDIRWQKADTTPAGNAPAVEQFGRGDKIELTAPTKLYSEAGKTLDTLPAGSTVKVIKDMYDCLEVKAGGKQGFVIKKDLHHN